MEDQDHPLRSAGRRSLTRHEPRACPGFASAHSGLNRPRSRDFSCAINASVDGRNAQIAVIPPPKRPIEPKAAFKSTISRLALFCVRHRGRPQCFSEPSRSHSSLQYKGSVETGDRLRLRSAELRFTRLTAVREYIRPCLPSEGRKGRGPSRLCAIALSRLRSFPGSRRQNSTRCDAARRAARRREA